MVVVAVDVEVTMVVVVVVDVDVAVAVVRDVIVVIVVVNVVVFSKFTCAGDLDAARVVDVTVVCVVPEVFVPLDFVGLGPVVVVVDFVTVDLVVGGIFRFDEEMTFLAFLFKVVQ